MPSRRPLRRKDVETFLQVKPEGELPAKRRKQRAAYEMGETVRVKEGPFADFSGEVIEMNEDQLKLKVLVNIFGRETAGRAGVQPGRQALAASVAEARGVHQDDGRPFRAEPPSRHTRTTQRSQR